MSGKALSIFSKDSLLKVSVRMAVVFMFLFVLSVGLSCSKKPKQGTETSGEDVTVAGSDETTTSSSGKAATQAVKKQADTPSKNVYEQWGKDEKKVRNAFTEAQKKQSSASKLSSAAPVQKLTEDQTYRAKKLLEMAMTERKMGRLPALGYGNMVKHCRELMKNFPGTPYAAAAKKMLADIPERYRERYHITEKEIK